MTETRERREQKARTREALLAGARQLIERGAPVTVAAAAAESGISKATAYRYFSDPSVLAAEAGLAVAVLPYEQVVAGAETARARALTVSLYIYDLSVAHEAAFRQFLARNLDAGLRDGGQRRMRRGARRVRMFEAALESERARIPPEEFDALVRGLTMATGSEAMIGLYDVACAPPAAARETVETVATLLLDLYLGAPEAD